MQRNVYLIDPNTGQSQVQREQEMKKKNNKRNINFNTSHIGSLFQFSYVILETSTLFAYFILFCLFRGKAKFTRRG